MHNNANMLLDLVSIITLYLPHRPALFFDQMKTGRYMQIFTLFQNFTDFAWKWTLFLEFTNSYLPLKYIHFSRKWVRVRMSALVGRGGACENIKSFRPLMMEIMRLNSWINQLLRSIILRVLPPLTLHKTMSPLDPRFTDTHHRGLALFGDGIGPRAVADDIEIVTFHELRPSLSFVGEHGEDTYFRIRLAGAQPRQHVGAIAASAQQGLHHRGILTWKKT